MLFLRKAFRQQTVKSQRRPKFVILQRMEVIFSHTTALDLLRIWSCNHPLALRAFHDLRSRDVGPSDKAPE